MKAWLTAGSALEATKKSLERVNRDIESGVRVSRQMHVDEQTASPEKATKLNTLRTEIERGIRAANVSREELLRMASAMAGFPEDARIELSETECFLLGDSTEMTNR